MNVYELIRELSEFQPFETVYVDIGQGKYIEVDAIDDYGSEPVLRIPEVKDDE
jgi:hypothetical protein